MPKFQERIKLTALLYHGIELQYICKERLKRDVRWTQAKRGSKGEKWQNGQLVDNFHFAQ